ncbi:hypothetical protein BDW66DRAFT_1748 [Aspergillus desertorum]
MIGRIVTYKSINPMPSDADSAQKRQAYFHEFQSALERAGNSGPPWCGRNTAL